MTTKYSWINGEFIPSDEAKIHVSDLAIQRGYGIFDYFKIIENQPVFLDDYLDRFYRSAKELFIPVKYERDELKHIIYGIIEKNDLPYSGMRFELTGGYSKDAYTISEPNFIIIQQALKLQDTIDKTGLKIKTFAHQRQLPQVKTIDYLMAIKTLSSGEYKDVDDILYYNEHSITECPRANFFIVTKDKVLKTAKDQILSGITRKHIIQLAKPLMPVEIGPISIQEVYEAEEAFISSTTKNIMPISHIDDKVIGNGQCGSVTDMLFTLLQEHIKHQTPSHTE
ncbi:aminotransferase class IV [Olivibacter sitiensis]|uniref:aminotransferase class IV n=1 Tax=Olivibacter sitiensis TaxID=376470 RepID=UPI000425242C|nr:aminotransferase class IV [Olivibacter sitiensis]